MIVASMRKTSGCSCQFLIRLLTMIRYGAVVRGTNAYVPPGARKPGAFSPPASNATIPKQDIPKVSVNGPDGTTVVAQTQSPSSSKAPSPAPAANANKVIIYI